MSSARLSTPEQRRVARVLREWAAGYGLALSEVFTETRPGAREAFDQMRTALTGIDPQTVVLSSWEHLAVDEREQAARLDDLEHVGAHVLTLSESPN